MTEAKSICVPKVVWDELENALMIKSKQLISEIAKVLRQDEKPLLQEFRSKKTNVMLLEVDREEEDKYECSALVSTTKVAHLCRRPTLYGKKFCPEHEYFRLAVSMESKPQLQKLSCSEEPLFVDSLTQQVYTVDYERVGYITKEKCIVFEVEEI
jgi:hypothetical protein